MKMAFAAAALATAVLTAGIPGRTIPACTPAIVNIQSINMLVFNDLNKTFIKEVFVLHASLGALNKFT